VGNAHEFKSGRELSAWLGLLPRQHSSGGKTVLLGISKRGDRYLRTLFIHGARSAVRTVERRKDLRSVSISRLKCRQGPNVAAVALANRNARVLWALLTRGESYRTTPFSARIPQLVEGRRAKNGDYQPEIARTVSMMMANRSDRHFPNLSRGEAHEAT
jgi:hypothetical protein